MTDRGICLIAPSWSKPAANGPPVGGFAFSVALHAIIKSRCFKSRYPFLFEKRNRIAISRDQFCFFSFAEPLIEIDPFELLKSVLFAPLTQSGKRSETGLFLVPMTNRNRVCDGRVHNVCGSGPEKPIVHKKLPCDPISITAIGYGVNNNPQGLIGAKHPCHPCHR